MTIRAGLVCTEPAAGGIGWIADARGVASPAGMHRFMPWRPADGGKPTLEALIRGLFEPVTFLDYLRTCVTFEEDQRGNIVKEDCGVSPVPRDSQGAGKRAGAPLSRATVRVMAEAAWSGTHRDRANR